MRSRMNAKIRSARCWSCFVTLGPYRTDVHLSSRASGGARRRVWREEPAGGSRTRVETAAQARGTERAPSGPVFERAMRPLAPPILGRVPIDIAVVFDYATRTFWALIVVVVTLLLARVVRRTTMRALTRGRAQANVTILLGNLAQVAMLTIGVLLVLAIYTRDAFGWILGSFSVVGIVLGL